MENETNRDDNSPLVIGPWIISIAAREIAGPAGVVRLEPKAAGVLLELARRPGQVIARQQLVERVWGTEMATDDVLSRAISELRRALGDDTRNPRYVVTVRGAGYRLVVPDAPSVAPSANPTIVPRSSKRRYRFASIAASVLAAAIATLGGVVAVRSAEPDREAPTISLVTPLTTRPGQESAPKLSPDGTRISYAWRDDSLGSQRVYVRLIDGSAELAVTPGDGDYQLSAWSPDGARLAISRADSGALGIYEVPALGGTPRLLVPVSGPYVLGLDWARDGRWLVYSALDTATMSFGTRLLELPSLRDHRLTSGARDAFGDVYATFSPDGRSVAFVRFFSEVASDVYVAPTEGGEPRRLTYDERPVTSIAFDADGRSLLYSANREGRVAVWRISLDGRDSVPRRVYDTAHGISGLAVMPSSAAIVVAEADQDLNLWTVPTDGSKMARRIAASTRLDALPRYSPDNARIAFVSDRTGESELWVSDGDGDNSFRVTQLGDIRGVPSWSPNGELVAVEREVRGRSQLWVVDIARRSAKRVQSPLRDAVAPTWAADGGSIYVSSRVGGTWQVFSVAVSDGAVTQLTTDGGMAARPTRDGQSILFVKPYVRGLWRLDLETQAESLVTSALGTGDCTNWDVAADGVYFVRRGADGRQSIVALALHGSMKVVAANVRVPVGSGGLSVTSDGRAIVYAQVDRRDGDLVTVSPQR